MTSITTPEFLTSFKTYIADHMFESALTDSGKRFLEATGRKSIAGIRYTTLCLIMAQAMENLLVGYGGCSYTNTSYLHEAIGYQLGNPSSDPMGVERYKHLVAAVHELQQNAKWFASLIENFLQ